MLLREVKEVSRKFTVFYPGVSAEDEATVVELGHRVNPAHELHA